MLAPMTRPPSRVNKKQIVAYLDKDLSVRAKTLRKVKNQTLQEFIAEAINCTSIAYKRPPLLPVDRMKVINRKRATAKASDSEGLAPSRGGKIRMAGWYEKRDVERVLRFSTEIGIKVEKIIEHGIILMLDQEESRQYIE